MYYQHQGNVLVVDENDPRVYIVTKEVIVEANKLKTDTEKLLYIRGQAFGSILKHKVDMSKLQLFVLEEPTVTSEVVSTEPMSNTSEPAAVTPAIVQPAVTISVTEQPVVSTPITEESIEVSTTEAPITVTPTAEEPVVLPYITTESVVESKPQKKTRKRKKRAAKKKEKKEEEKQNQQNLLARTLGKEKSQASNSLPYKRYSSSV